MNASHPASVTVTRRGAQRLRDGHLWVFDGDLADRGEASPGEAVTVRDPSGRTIGTAHYSSTSKIALRLLSREAVPIDRDFYQRRLSTALDHRRRFVHNTDACRLVHAEGDLLPALVVDRYDSYLAVQTLSQGMDRNRDVILECLRDLISPAGIVLRNDVALRRREGLPTETAVVHGEIPGTIGFRMNGLSLAADLRQGQKTGLFLDQRENYLAAARYAGGRALDCFTSTGGFALHLAGACESVEAIDSSERALAAAEQNAERNSIENIQFREADVFDLLSGYGITGRRFETIVLDPPAFAKSRAAVHKALDAYREINFRALQILEPGGVLVTCSCSHHVTEAMLMETLGACAGELGRTIRVIECRRQPPDHPVLLQVPETLYLKCLIVQAL